MPPLPIVKGSNLTFSPSYIPVAVFAGGTSGVGQAMAEPFARQTNGRAHIILGGRNAVAATNILAGLPKPSDSDGWAHEFVPCEATSMVSVRAAYADLRSRLPHLKFLVMSAGANSMVWCGETAEGLDHHLCYSRYTYVKELLPLLISARDKGQHARAMSVLGAGFGATIPADDLGLENARRSTIKLILKGMIRGVAYNDGLMAHFAAQNPDLAFTHIPPGQVTTPGSTQLYMGWLSPLAWIINHIMPFKQISAIQEECAQYMLYVLFDSERGVFIRDNYADLVIGHLCQPEHATQFDAQGPAAHKVRMSTFSDLSAPH
ncbi:hypothetical protein FB451DRAFT_1031955 [Mycena latifolia]|nr:hypothetical protein FB451DRAFT_1031955 [Mycena latifolia]